MQDIGFQIGIALVLMLMVYVNMNDILRDVAPVDRRRYK